MRPRSWARGRAGRAWGAREGAGPARRGARERRGLSGAARHPEPAGGAARSLRPPPPPPASCARAGPRARGPVSAGGAAGRRGAARGAPRAGAAPNPRTRERPDGVRETETLPSFPGGMAVPSPIAQPCHPLATPPPGSPGPLGPGARGSPLVAGPRRGRAWRGGRRRGRAGPAASGRRPWVPRWPRAPPGGRATLRPQRAGVGPGSAAAASGVSHSLGCSCTPFDSGVCVCFSATEGHESVQAASLFAEAKTDTSWTYRWVLIQALLQHFCV